MAKSKKRRGASAAALLALRKKYKLGEFKVKSERRRKSKTRKTAKRVTRSRKPASPSVPRLFFR